MTKLTVLTFITGLVMAFTVASVALGQTTTTTPTTSPNPTEVVPTSAPATGRG